MTEAQDYLREVQYRHPDRLAARSLLHTRYGRGDWFAWLAAHIPLPAGATVADIGCGAGAFWRGLPPGVPDDLRPRLVDLSPGMVDAARATLAEVARWSDILGIVADAAALPFQDQSIATVLAIHMLYHLDDPARGLTEMARVTQAGGTIAVVPNPAGTMAQLSELMGTALGMSGRRPAPLSSEDGRALMRARFGAVNTVRYDDTLVVTDPLDLLAYLTSLPPAEEPGASDRLAAAVAEAFRSNTSFRITKASDLLLATV